MKYLILFMLIGQETLHDEAVRMYNFGLFDTIEQCLEENKLIKSFPNQNENMMYYCQQIEFLK